VVGGAVDSELEKGITSGSTNPGNSKDGSMDAMHRNEQLFETEACSYCLANGFGFGGCGFMLNAGGEQAGGSGELLLFGQRRQRIRKLDDIQSATFENSGKTLPMEEQASYVVSTRPAASQIFEHSSTNTSADGP
jgi:hypothetical protein